MVSSLSVTDFTWFRFDAMAKAVKDHLASKPSAYILKQYKLRGNFYYPVWRIFMSENGLPPTEDYSKELDEYFQNQVVILDDERRFRTKLKVGREVYGALRLVENVKDIVLSLPTGAAAGLTAQNMWIASLSTWQLIRYNLNFFAPQCTIWIASATAAGMLCSFIFKKVSNKLSRHIDNITMERPVPKFLNTQLDLLAWSVASVLSPPAIKIAAAGNNVSLEKVSAIKKYFTYQWGYNENYIEQLIETQMILSQDFDYNQFAQNLRRVCNDIPEIGFEIISVDLFRFIEEILNAGGIITPQVKLEFDLFRSILQGNKYPNEAKHIVDGNIAFSQAMNTLQDSSSSTDFDSTVKEMSGTDKLNWNMIEKL